MRIRSCPRRRARLPRRSLLGRLQVFPWNPRGSWVDVCVASLVLGIVIALCSREVALSAKTSFATLVIILLCIASTLLCVMIPTTVALAARMRFLVLVARAPEAHMAQYPLQPVRSELLHTIAHRPVPSPQSPVPTGFNLTTLANNAAPNLSAFSGSSDSSIMLMFVLVFPGFTGVLGKRPPPSQSPCAHTQGAAAPQTRQPLLRHNSSNPSATPHDYRRAGCWYVSSGRASRRRRE